MMFKKRFISILSVLTLLFFVTACSSETSNESADEGSKEGNDNEIVIGVTNTTMKTPVYEFMKQGAEKKAEELGVTLLWQSSELDPQKQLDQVDSFISQGIDVLVIEPADDSSAKQHVQLAKNAGIPVINLEYYIEGADIDLRIVGDSVAVGEMQVKAFLEEWGDEPANVVILSGTAGSEVAESITQGNLNIIEQNPNLNLVGHQYHDAWDRELAMNSMENILTQTNNDVQAVFANNDGMILGAMRAAENAGVKDEIIFYGSDNDEEVIKAMLEGEPVRTIDKSAILQGENIVEAAVKLAKGEEPPHDDVIDGIPIWYTPVSLVNMENLEKAKEKFPHLFNE